MRTMALSVVTAVALVAISGLSAEGGEKRAGRFKEPEEF